MGKKDELNCDYVGFVNFGEGPVKVRCTETGPHDEHKVEVILAATVPEERYNVFDDDDDV